MPITHQKSIETKTDEPILREGGPLLQVDNLSYTYPDGQPALNDISLKIYPGEKVALVGPNGSGKSTLMLHTNGILGDGEGIQVGKINLTPQNFGLVRSMVGLVFQNPDDQLFSPTVREDIAFGPLHMGLQEEEVRQRVENALEMVKMNGFADRISHHLSVGEKKRIAIATVLAMEPEVYILDEPSAGLDPRARRQLIDLLAELPITMLVATHDLYLVRDLLPRMIIMDQGRVVADGLTRDLLADSELLAAHGLELP